MQKCYTYSVEVRAQLGFSLPVYTVKNERHTLRGIVSNLYGFLGAKCYKSRDYLHSNRENPLHFCFKGSVQRDVWGVARVDFLIRADQLYYRKDLFSKFKVTPSREYSSTKPVSAS
jgi:hypothetical protein